MNLFIRFVLSIFLVSLLQAAPVENENKISDTVVRIFTSARVPSHSMPWQAKLQRYSGSGVLIGNRRILTNAHVVSYATYIEVQRRGERRRYRAKVVGMNHALDLALLQVEDPDFLRGIQPLELGSLPEPGTRIGVYGYPEGGETLSVSRGVVSRIESLEYAHSQQHFLQIQMDAAVGPGSSGGPALSDGKIVGVEMQSQHKGARRGYLVPPPLIRQFLTDLEDGKVDGVPHPGFLTQPMENPALRAQSGMPGDLHGVRVYKVLPGRSAEGIVKEGDLLLSVEGHPVGDDGRVTLRPGLTVEYAHLIHLHQIGDSISLALWRDGKRLEVSLPLKETGDRLYRVPTPQFRPHPRYFLLGGYLFVPLTRELVFGEQRYNLAYCPDLPAYATARMRERVILLRLLEDESNRGYGALELWPIETLDGKPFAEFETFVSRIKESNASYIVLKDPEGKELVIDRKEALRRQKAIMERYGIGKAEVR